jgi:hypothetical protein
VTLQKATDCSQGLGLLREQGHLASLLQQLDGVSASCSGFDQSTASLSAHNLPLCPALLLYFLLQLATLQVAT